MININSVNKYKNNRFLGSEKFRSSLNVLKNKYNIINVLQTKNTFIL